MPGSRRQKICWVTRPSESAQGEIHPSRLRELNRRVAEAAEIRREFAGPETRSRDRATLIATERFVLSGVSYENEYHAGVFDVLADQLIERSRTTERRITAAQTAGRGDRLFRTTTRQLVEYRVSRDGVLETVATHSGTFSSIELQFSTDGSTLYGASLAGLKRWDVSGNEPVPLDTLWPALERVRRSRTSRRAVATRV